MIHNNLGTNLMNILLFFSGKKMTFTTYILDHLLIQERTSDALKQNFKFGLAKKSYTFKGSFTKYVDKAMWVGGTEK